MNLGQVEPGTSAPPIEQSDGSTRPRNQQRNRNRRSRGFRTRNQTGTNKEINFNIYNNHHNQEEFNSNLNNLTINHNNEHIRDATRTSRGARGGLRRIRPTIYGHNRNDSTENHDDNVAHGFEENLRYPTRGRFRDRNTHNINALNEESNLNLSSSETVTCSENNTARFTDSKVQSEIVERQLKTNNFECMICCDNVNRYQPIWCCSNCYNIFHLKCSIEWCNKSIKSRNEAIASAQYPSLNQGPSSSTATLNVARQTNEGFTEYQTERMNSIEWPCPACREILYTRPGKYKCFCGKVIRPEVNKHLTPHSCGQLCGRKRPNVECPHNCNTICHPGRCNPCPLTSERSCNCGKLTEEVKCSMGTFTCDNICGKLLSCGVHYCDKLCHEGSCQSCEEIVIIKCHCGNQETSKLCSEYSIMKQSSNRTKELSKLLCCGKICGKLLDCGKHYCQDKCHSDPNCKSCKFLSQNIRTCPCGSTMLKKSVLLERKSCTDAIPTCEKKCNRTLICGPDKNRHKCQKKCHIGACPPCKLKTTAHCECNLSTKTIDCGLMYEKIEVEDQLFFKQVEYTFTCEARCNRPKNCGRHRCNNKCCKAIKETNSPLHRCDQICNKKLPCGQHNCPEVCHSGQCGDCTNIGWEELTCHCGGSVLYPPIPCGSKRPICHRPCRRAHDCGHPVKHECHDDNESCAPCIVFVKKSCFCGTDSKNSVYCYLPGYSCGRTCKKLLACKQHKCERVCHDNDCETPNDKGSILCVQPCPVIRYSCKHPCSVPCHGKTPCPMTDCRKMLEISCECGNRSERIECHKAMRDEENRNMLAMLSSTRSNQDSSIIVDLSKKIPPKSSLETSGDSQLKKLECDETCSLLKRNKALAEALEIAQPDLKPSSIFGDDPLRLLREATVQDYKFVSTTFNSLSKFVKASKDSEKRFIFMQFPPAEKLRREVVHELAYHFNCTSETVGDEPFRHVVVRAYKNKSTVPDFNIEMLLPVQD